MTRHRALLAAAITVALLLVSAASADAADSSHFGARFGQWVRAHPANATHCRIDTCYGPLVDSRSLQPEFSFVQTMRHRVAGYNQALRRGTPLLAAELQVVEQLPADVNLPRAVTVIRHDRYGHSCAVVDLYSASLAAEFGPKGLAGQGNSIGVELATAGSRGLTTFNPDSIDLAIVVPEYLGANTTC